MNFVQVFWDSVENKIVQTEVHNGVVDKTVVGEAHEIRKKDPHRQKRESVANNFCPTSQDGGELLNHSIILLCDEADTYSHLIFVV